MVIQVILILVILLQTAVVIRLLHKQRKIDSERAADTDLLNENSVGTYTTSFGNIPDIARSVPFVYIFHEDGTVERRLIGKFRGAFSSIMDVPNDIEHGEYVIVNKVHLVYSVQNDNAQFAQIGMQPVTHELFDSTS